MSIVLRDGLKIDPVTFAVHTGQNDGHASGAFEPQYTSIVESSCLCVDCF